jgi:predicted O-methyltransferase YrrM
MPIHPETSFECWQAVDAYFESTIVPSDPVLDATRAATAAAGMPDMAVAPNQGKLLQILALAVGARRILEIGTLGGYSTIWLARALPADGRLITLEYDPLHAQVATTNLAHAGLAGQVEVRIGAALDSLPLLATEDTGPFDLVFIDADKQNNPDYLEWAIRLTRPGGLIVVDNVVRHGRVANPESVAPDVIGTRRMFGLLAAVPRVEPTAIQTVGSKGLDGLALVYVR